MGTAHQPASLCLSLRYITKSRLNPPFLLASPLWPFPQLDPAKNAFLRIFTKCPERKLDLGLLKALRGPLRPRRAPQMKPKKPLNLKPKTLAPLRLAPKRLPLPRKETSRRPRMMLLLPAMGPGTTCPPLRWDRRSWPSSLRTSTKKLPQYLAHKRPLLPRTGTF